MKIQKIFDGVNFHAFILKLPRTQVSGYLSQVQMLHYTLYSLTRMQLLTKCTKILLKPKLFKHSFKTFRMANTTLILWKLQLYDKGWKTIGNIFIASLQLWIIESASVFWSKSSGTIWRVCHASCRVGKHQRIFRQTSHASHREHLPCTEKMFWKISREHQLHYDDCQLLMMFYVIYNFERCWIN